MGEKGKYILQKFVDIFSGEIILKRGWDRHITFVLYCFALISLYITWSLIVENRMVQIRKNDTIINDLKIEYYQKDLELIGLNKRSKIEKMLIDNGNTVLHAPLKPPKRIIIE